MFIQVIQGRTGDAAGLRRQFDRWNSEIGPSAGGFLGSTGGVADDGTFVEIVRFADEAAARANSERTEQGAWWNETEKFFDGDVGFRDSTDVEEPLGPGSDKAGFVQVMQGRVTDRAKLDEIERGFVENLRPQRPDLLGSVRAWDGDFFTEAIYFSTEAEAREAERNMAPDALDELNAVITEPAFIDLKDPWLFTK